MLMSEEEFKSLLNPTQYRVMREKDTEEAFSGKYNEHKERGIYTCAACGNFLFLSIHKFDAKNGWPAFKKPISKRNVVHSMVPGNETEIVCKECSSHLGSIKKNGESSYYSINSIALDFHELPEIEWDSDDSEKEERQSNQVKQSPVNVTNITLLAGGIVLGAGAASVILSLQAATLLCQNLMATSTPIAVANVQQMTQPPTSVPVVKPRENSVGAPTQSAALTPTPSSTTSSATPADASGSTGAEGTI